MIRQVNPEHVFCDALVRLTDAAQKQPGSTTPDTARKAAEEKRAQYVIKGACRTGEGLAQTKASLEENCRTALECAITLGCQSVAVPLFTAGELEQTPAEALHCQTNALLQTLQTTLEEPLVILTMTEAQGMLVRKALRRKESWVTERPQRIPEPVPFVPRFSDEAFEVLTEPDFAPCGLLSQNGSQTDFSESSPFGAGLTSGTVHPAAPQSNLAQSEKKRDTKRRHITTTVVRKKSAQAELSEARCERGEALWDSDPALERLLGQLDESFSQMLLRLIDEANMSDAQCYKLANVDRKLFSKIRSDAAYRPSKTTVLAFALALQLSLEQTECLLRTAGYALSHSQKLDRIVEYCIRRGVYNVHTVNEVLFAYDQPLLGSA